MMKITKDDQGMVVFVDELGESAVVSGPACVGGYGEILACQVAA